MTIQEVVAKFNTTPFLFAGSGITRRYYGLPTWKELLKHFAMQISNDRFAYNAYESMAEGIDHPNGLLPLTATLIQKEYDAAWYKTPALRTLSPVELEAVENGISPFKMEVAAYLRRNSTTVVHYENEINKLKNLAKKNLSGVITTNYDLFFEQLFPDYKSFVGQDNLCFSPIQGIAEIYKIHGSIAEPNSIVINNADYQIFHDKGKYLASKLLTIFMEYPIIFIGYSLVDTNIRNILTDISVCIPEEKMKLLQERFIFVEYCSGMSGYDISEYEIDLGGKRITMTKLSLEDFGILYDALTVKMAAVPVKLLRRFKEDLYSFVVSKEPGTTLKVSALDNPNLLEDNLVISIGLQETGEYGYQRLLDVNGWYRNIVLDDLPASIHSYDKLLELTYPGVKHETQGYIPVCKYLAYAQEKHPDIETTVPESFDALLCTTNRKGRSSVAQYSSVLELWNREKQNPKRACRLLLCLPEERICVDELDLVLHEMFDIDPGVLSNKTMWVPSDVKRIIRIYDYLKWGQKKT